MDRYEARRRYWQLHPPTHLLVQAIAISIGINSAKPRGPDEASRGDIEDLRAMFPGGIRAEHLRG